MDLLHHATDVKFDEATRSEKVQRYKVMTPAELAAELDRVREISLRESSGLVAAAFLVTPGITS